MEQNQQSFRYVTSNNNSTKGKRKSHRRAVSGVNTHTYTNLAKKKKKIQTSLQLVLLVKSAFERKTTF